MLNSLNLDVITSDYDLILPKKNKNL